MSRLKRRTFLHMTLAAAGGAAAACMQPRTAGQAAGETIDLPPPRQEESVSIEATLSQRRSVRAYTDQALSREEIGQMLWAAQGVTHDRGARTAPSAGGLYPLELYAVTRDGQYHYLPAGHQVDHLAALGLQEKLWAAGLKQEAIRQAPVVFLIAAVYERTRKKYGDRTERYVHMEAGHAAQNLLLQAVALGLGGVPIGAFDDDQVAAALDLPPDHAPLYLIPVGHPAE